MNDFDRMFTDFINRKHGEGWKYKNCQFHLEGDKGSAFCVFKQRD